MSGGSSAFAAAYIANIERLVSGRLLTLVKT